LKEAEGKPLKKIVLRNAKGQKPGELVVTRYGLEGTPVYFLGTPGPIELDLLPDLTEEEVLKRLHGVRENLSPLRRVKKVLSLSEAASALLFHELPAADKNSLEVIAKRVKSFPLILKSPRPLEEAISSKGGVALSALTSDFQLKVSPNIYAVGEMLAWDAPTGGFLIQACVTQAAYVAKIIAAKLGA
jgi:predicted flavoprotein YhiN